MDVTTIERIAGSQFVWTILFIILGVAVIAYLKNESDKREKMLEESQKEQKKDAENRFKELKNESTQREDKLMDNLKSLTDSQERTAKSIEGLNQAYTGLKDDYSHLAKRVDFIEKRQITN